MCVCVCVCVCAWGHEAVKCSDVCGDIQCNNDFQSNTHACVCVCCESMSVCRSCTEDLEGLRRDCH